MQNREDDPNFVFRSSINKALYGENIRRNLPSEENIRSIDKDRALQIFKERFADASDFTFTIVGSFKEEEILPYLEEYLAGYHPQTVRNPPKTSTSFRRRKELT